MILTRTYISIRTQELQTNYKHILRVLVFRKQPLLVSTLPKVGGTICVPPSSSPDPTYGITVGMLVLSFHSISCTLMI